MKTKRKHIELAVFFGLIAAILLSMARFDEKCESLRQNVFRLHIIADSDQAEDQKVKLLVRDEIVVAAEKLFADEKDLDGAVKIAECNLAYFTDIANDTLRKNGFDYRAAVTVENTHFDTRVYDDFTLPAGTYRSLNIRLGKAQGKNWWCVIFPAVCVSAAEQHSLSESTNEKAVRIAEDPQPYKIRFFGVEMYEKLRYFLEN